MSTDQNSIPKGLLNEILRGLEQEEQSFAEEVCTIRRPDKLESSIPLIESEDMVTRDQNRNLPEGAEAKPNDQEMDKVSYKATRDVGYDFVTTGPCTLR